MNSIGWNKYKVTACESLNRNIYPYWSASMMVVKFRIGIRYIPKFAREDGQLF